MASERPSGDIETDIEVPSDTTTEAVCVCDALKTSVVESSAEPFTKRRAISLTPCTVRVPKKLEPRRTRSTRRSKTPRSCLRDLRELRGKGSSSWAESGRTRRVNRSAWDGETHGHL